jgi:hypothetical protein
VNAWWWDGKLVVVYRVAPAREANGTVSDSAGAIKLALER